MRTITLGHLDISPTGKKYVSEAMDNNRLSAGPFTEKFEREFAKLHESRHAIFCNSGTSALQISLEALKEAWEYPADGEVLVPATTFIATSNVVLQSGLKPVFVDVDPRTYNIDPGQIEQHITPNTQAIMPVHLLGLPADMTSIKQIVDKHDIQIIEDSCETMFAKCDGKSVGSLGDIAAFSTHVAHFVVGGVGGLVTTDDDHLAEVCRSLMQHGRDSIYTNIDADDMPTNDIVNRRYKFDRVGHSYRATEFEAAIALSELERWEKNIQARQSNAYRLAAILARYGDCLQLPITPSGFDHSFMMFPIVVKGNVNRDALIEHLENHGVETRQLFPLLSQPIYRRLFPGLDDQYPVAQHLARNGFFVGIHQGLTEDDVDYLGEQIESFLASR